MILPPIHHILLHAAVSTAVAVVSHLLDLPSLALYGLHTYIHPDSIPSAAGGGIAVRPTDAHPASSRRRVRPQFDESKAQLLRLRLSPLHLRSRLFSRLYRSTSIAVVVFLSNLLVSDLLRLRSPSLLALAAAGSAVHLLSALATLSFNGSFARRSEKHLSFLVGASASIFSLLILFPLSPSVFHLPSTASGSGLTVSALLGCLAALLFPPASRSARTFFLGTDQLRWNLPVVSGGPLTRILLYTSLLLSIITSLLWVNSISYVLGGGEESRIWVLVAAAVSQLLALRSNVQMYLNEAVLCWYQRLQECRSPEMEYGRAKVFLHNQCICCVALQFSVPPLLVLILTGLSHARGNLFESLLLIGIPEYFSDVMKQMSLFLAWWIMFVWSILTLLNLSLYRYGFLFIL